MPPCHGGDQGFKSPRGRLFKLFIDIWPLPRIYPTSLQEKPRVTPFSSVRSCQAAWQALDTETLVEFWVSELNKRLEINISREEGTIANIDDLVQRNKLEEFKDAVLALCQKIES